MIYSIPNWFPNQTLHSQTTQNFNKKRKIWLVWLKKTFDTVWIDGLLGVVAKPRILAGRQQCH